MAAEASQPPSQPSHTRISVLVRSNLPLARRASVNLAITLLRRERCYKRTHPTPPAHRCHPPPPPPAANADATASAAARRLGRIRSHRCTGSSSASPPPAAAAAAATAAPAAAPGETSRGFAMSGPPPPAGFPLAAAEPLAAPLRRPPAARGGGAAMPAGAQGSSDGGLGSRTPPLRLDRRWPAGSADRVSCTSAVWGSLAEAWRLGFGLTQIWGWLRFGVIQIW